ncbi:hypothetical protein E2C00_16970 [Streptomyces sp. WAC05374]|uniref:hypothetical protein n=1 Tax=Streptomyces sp. WAC05374 TaxID=2487420 RepID=UPI000F88460E|nr:hypothetical protein [Streptomyces sp. WAC05374]RST12021.1 hypothetical protein EF905_23640 [Streptomyces sp. WAC05374]TDF54614.1 hypothetical protein E2C00_16970 [Streptomyces sp. WAC05374]TDF56249.1 hypothetical protein E2C02_12425 [Streptomyces sp. WAC05374]
MPRTAEQGEALVDHVVLRPADWGAGFVAQPVAESPPRTVAVLDERCQWQREPLPSGVLASLSRYAELPGREGKGTVRVTAVATVHTSELGADEQLSVTLEEVLRCRRQEIRVGERLEGLESTGTPFGARGQHWADDNVYERGTYVSAEGAHPYTWSVARVGSVTIGVSVKGAKGYSTAELSRWITETLPVMGERVKQRTGRET